MTEASTVARLSAATKRYGDTVALDGIDLAIRQGEVVAILGPNGAGKTTAISLLLGLRGPTSGTAELYGRPPSDPEARARCGVMLQESGVPALLTVRETIALFSSHYRYPMPVRRVLALARLEDKAHATVATLSGGQRQRLYYGLALCGDPETLFLDEPTVGMDTASRRSLVDDIRSFAVEGKTIVLTTHYIEEAERIARRVVVIDHGRIVADGTPAEIKSVVPAKRVRFRAPNGFGVETLAGLAAERIDVDGADVHFLSNDPASVIGSLVSKGIPLIDLEVGGADLEEAFLALTTRRRS